MNTELIEANDLHATANELWLKSLQREKRLLDALHEIANHSLTVYPEEMQFIAQDAINLAAKPMDRACEKCGEWVYFDNGDATSHCLCGAGWRFRNA